MRQFLVTHLSLLFVDSGVGVLHYLQSMTSNLSLGAEFLLQKIPGMEVGALSLAGNYKGEEWEVIGKAGLHQWSLCKYSITCTLQIFKGCDFHMCLLTTCHPRKLIPRNVFKASVIQMKYKL